MKKLLVLAALATLSLSNLASANYLDDITQKTKADVQRKEIEDKSMLARGELSVGYAQKYVSQVGHANGPYFQLIYAYIAAGKGDDIKWNQDLLITLKNQLANCNQASSIYRSGLKENELINNGFAGDTYQQDQVRHNLVNLDKANLDRMINMCLGTNEAQNFADKFVRENPTESIQSNKDLFSK